LFRSRIAVVERTELDERTQEGTVPGSGRRGARCLGGAPVEQVSLEEGSSLMATSDPRTDEVWEEFHSAVNMSSEELRRWLLADASGEEAFPNDGGVDRAGERIGEVLN